MTASKTFEFIVTIKGTGVDEESAYKDAATSFSSDTGNNDDCETTLVVSDCPICKEEDSMEPYDDAPVDSMQCKNCGAIIANDELDMDYVEDPEIDEDPNHHARSEDSDVE